MQMDFCGSFVIRAPTEIPFSLSSSSASRRLCDQNATKCSKALSGQCCRLRQGRHFLQLESFLNYRMRVGSGGQYENVQTSFRGARNAVSRFDVQASPELKAFEELSEWLKAQGFPDQAVTVKTIEDEDLGLAALRPLKVGEVALKVPENYCVTAFDVSNHPVVSMPASGRDDLIGLSLWLMYERTQGAASFWYPFLRLFPERTLSPLLWTETELEEQLRGTSVLEKTKERIAALEEEYVDLKTSYFDKDLRSFPEVSFSFLKFKNAFAAILSRAFYLPSADIVALIPYGDCVNHRSDVKAFLDYSAADQAVVLKVDRNYEAGQQVFVTYGEDLPNTDLVISYGFVDEKNPNNYLETQVDLLPVDRLRGLKQDIIEQAGFEAPQKFPLFENRFPTQGMGYLLGSDKDRFVVEQHIWLLTYLRLSRLTDVGLFAKIVFERDVIVDQSNEYEILMLLMGDCRTKLQEYSGNADDEFRILNDKGRSTLDRFAAKVRLAEKRIWTNTMGALRNRLAPIRGIPVKGGGMKDPNADLLEVFDVAEQVATAPVKFLANIFNKKQQ